MGSHPSPKFRDSPFKGFIGTDSAGIETDIRKNIESVARELELNGRRFWIVSDPEGTVWKAKVVELRAGGEADEIGIDASAETRTAADAAAEKKLRRLLGLGTDD